MPTRKMTKNWMKALLGIVCLLASTIAGSGGIAFDDGVSPSGGGVGIDDQAVRSGYIHWLSTQSNGYGAPGSLSLSVWDQLKGEWAHKVQLPDGNYSLWTARVAANDISSLVFVGATVGGNVTYRVDADGQVTTGVGAEVGQGHGRIHDVCGLGPEGYAIL